MISKLPFFFFFFTCLVELDRKVSVVYASESNGQAGKIWSHLDFIWGMNKLFGKELLGWLLDVIFPDFWRDVLLA